MSKIKKSMMQSNIMISAKDNLTRDQRRLLYIFMWRLYKTNKWPVDGSITFCHKEYAEIFKIGEQEARHDLRKATLGFRGKYIKFYEDWDGETAEVEIDWTTERKSSHIRGRYEIKINHSLKKHLMPLASQFPFTILDLNHLALFESKWSQKLYEALLQFKNTGVFTVKNINTLHERWGTPPSYQKYSAFKNRVLLPSITELRRIDELKSLTMTEKFSSSHSTKVVGLQFTFTPIERR